MKQTNNKYGIKSLKKDFPNETSCLDFIFDTLHSRDCSCGGSYSLIKGRRQYQCSKCRFQIAPTAGTIFHKSSTPLTMWFHAILVFSNAKSGISAKQLERQLEVTYKCAWRILTLIRKSLARKDNDKLSGEVETDGAYFGGKGYGGKYNENAKEVMKKKGVVLAAIERGGKVIAEVVPDMTAKTYGDFIQRNVETKETKLLSDSTKSLQHTRALGYDRHSVNHRSKEYVRGYVHVNNVETFWSHVKRSMKGTHKVISSKYLQDYINGFVFHYNNRHSDKERFSALLGALLRA